MSTSELGHALYAALDGQDWVGVEALVHPDLAVWLDSAPPVGFAPWRAGLEQFHLGFPDGHHLIEETLVDGDAFVTRCRFEGTHTGPFAGIAPTGVAISTRVIHIDRFSDGRLVEHHGQLDVLGLLRQIGAA